MRFSHDPTSIPVELLERSKIDPEAFEKRLIRRLLELLCERFESSVRVCKSMKHAITFTIIYSVILGIIKSNISEW